MFKMERDDKLLIAAIFLSLVIILVGANFNGITGNIIRDQSKTDIAISPKAVSPGQQVYITIIPGSEGVNQKTSFYQAEDDLRKSSVKNLCNNYICKNEGSFSFIIPLYWESGVYHIKVYDYALHSFVIEDFTVVG